MDLSAWEHSLVNFSRKTKIIVNAAHGILKCGSHYKNQNQNPQKTPLLNAEITLILDYSNHKQQATMWIGNSQINQGNNRSQALD